MLRPKLALNLKQMLTQPQDNHNNPQLEIAIQKLVEAHIGMMQVWTQNVANRDSKELPLGVQQVLDDHSRIV
jgi:hypothetical protein